MHLKLICIVALSVIYLQVSEITCQTSTDLQKNSNYNMTTNPNKETIPLNGSVNNTTPTGTKHMRKKAKSLALAVEEKTTTNSTSTTRKQRRRRKKKKPKSATAPPMLNVGKTQLISAEQTTKKNRCRKNNGGCAHLCRPHGKTKCSCLQGYILAKDRKKCVDRDECRVHNGDCQHTCKNWPGGYHCECPPGFRIADDPKSCQDINECHLRNGHGPCHGSCTNTHGGYMCRCSHGTRLADDKHSCEDVDECEEGTSGCTHNCINAFGAVFCSCPAGMELVSDYKTCQDVDECATTSVQKSCQGCVNTIGSYYCEGDFQKDHISTQARVCPPLNPPEHGFLTCLRNTSLSFNKGRKILKNIPGTKCHLVCPIGYKLIGSNRVVCGIFGQWLTEKKGFCTRAPHPTLACPPDQVLSLEQGQTGVVAHFPLPRTNVRWQMVKSYPEWARKLKGELGEGRHGIQFSVTDPATNLSATCSFVITVRK